MLPVRGPFPESEPRFRVYSAKCPQIFSMLIIVGDCLSTIADTRHPSLRSSASQSLILQGLATEPVLAL